MTVPDEVTVLARAHELFAGSPGVARSGGPAVDAQQVLRDGQPLSGAAFERYRQRAAQAHFDLRSGGATDAQLLSILRGAVDDHAAARHQTRVILDAARADSAPAADTPMGQRELMRRRIARLRAQSRTVSGARARALRRLLLLRALAYQRRRGAGARGPLNTTAAGRADEKGLQHYTKLMNRAVSAAFPQIREIGGWREDRLHWHPDGLALDIMIPNYDTPAGRDLGNRIVEFLIRNRGPLGLDHMMWRQRQINANGTSSLMGDRGSDTENHFDHIHVVSIGGGY
ncbi:putative uncharacterized protein [Mycolicibacterium novocastrense]|nr:putative uncharacterized protein [Mycolicibacterium novocastrense]